MKGYPKHINNKHDLEAAYKIDPEKTKELVRGWQKYREGWYTTTKLKSAEDGITDDRHRVNPVTLDDGGTEYYQEEYGAIPGNRIDRLGLTETDLKTYS